LASRFTPQLQSPGAKAQPNPGNGKAIVLTHFIAKLEAGWAGVQEALHNSSRLRSQGVTLSRRGAAAGQGPAVTTADLAVSQHRLLRSEFDLRDAGFDVDPLSRLLLLFLIHLHDTPHSDSLGHAVELTMLVGFGCSKTGERQATLLEFGHTETYSLLKHILFSVQ